MSHSRQLIVLLSILILTKHNGYAQFANNWFFGNHLGMNFSSGSPVNISNGQTANADNTSTISDNNGNLLFYTDGMSVWDKTNTIMPNGTGLIGHPSAGQCCLIVPIPCNSTKYVIFHNTEFSNPGNLSYSVVDMSLNSGFGDVVVGQKNISLGTGWTEKLCAYYNPTGHYYWVLTHKWLTNQFVAFKVDPSSIAITSVTTSIGSVHNCGTYGGAHDAMGQLTISPNGSLVANALTCQDKYELFQFDINTGILSNQVTIPGMGGSAWGTAFSPNSNILYTNTIFGQTIDQFDLSSYSQPLIQASHSVIYNTGTGGYNFGYMELGPDSKIYIARPNTNWLAAINTPNNLGSSSGFSFNAVSTGANTSSWGVSRIAYNIPAVASGGTMSISSNVTSVTCFGALNGSATITPNGSSGPFSYSWTPGGYTTQTVNSLSPGTYTVHVSDGACSSGTTAITITQPPALTSSISISSWNGCTSPATLSLNNGGGTSPYSVLWSTGANTSSITVTPSVSSVYNATVTDGHGCVNTSSTTISINKISPTFTFSIAPCSQLVSYTNTTGPSVPFQWLFGDSQTSSTTSPTHLYSTDGTYTVDLITSPATLCADTIQHVVQIQNIHPTAAFQYTYSPCNASVSFINNSANGLSYDWDFGDGHLSSQNSPSHLYPGSGNYSVTLIATSSSGCKDTAIVNAGINMITINAGFSYTTATCGDSSHFTNTTANDSLMWFIDNNMLSQSNTFAYPLGTGTHTVALTVYKNGCNAQVKETILIASLDLNPDSIPNVFTPNEDGINETFNLEKFMKCNRLTFDIYNRWGLPLFKSSDSKSNFWDGRTSSGEKVPDGTYFYIISDESGNKIKGTVTIFR